MKNDQSGSSTPQISAFQIAGKNFKFPEVFETGTHRAPHASARRTPEAKELARILAEVEEALAARRPARDINAGHSSVVGWITGDSSADPIAFESTIERDFLYVTLFDNRVSGVQHQPVSIKFDDPEGRHRSYTPDYLVEHAPTRQGWRKTLIECKPQRKWQKNRERMTERFTAASLWARRFGMDFRLVTDDMIRGDRLDNVRRLWPARFASINRPDRLSSALNAIFAQLPAANGALLDALSDEFPDTAMLQSEILQLVADGEAVCDLNKPLTMSTVLYRRGNAFEPDHVFEHGLQFGGRSEHDDLPF